MDFLSGLGPLAADVPLTVLAISVVFFVVYRVLVQQGKESDYHDKSSAKLLELFARNMEVTDKLESAINLLAEVQERVNKYNSDALEQHNKEVLDAIRNTEGRLVTEIRTVGRNSSGSTSSATSVAD